MAELAFGDAAVNHLIMENVFYVESTNAIKRAGQVLQYDILVDALSAQQGNAQAACVQVKRKLPRNVVLQDLAPLAG